ncbi:hypothetical protein [Parapedobacter sp. DT-150]|uniref:hypothetical protein n=1 Tax=Parapedobacter sp. DT-150 TaxID=3396162 RepID=UPI003F53FEC2
MKQRLITLLCLFGLPFSSCTQKSALSTATAEACIAFIEQLANTRAADDGGYSYSFNGTVLIETNKIDEHTITKDQYQHIDWAKFTEVSNNPSGGGAINISFDFDRPISRFWEVQYEGRPVYRSSDIPNTFNFSIPVAQQPKIKELEIAANRLAQLAKSKASPLLAVSIPLDALKPLPNRSETEEYILSKLHVYNGTDAKYDRKFSLADANILMNLTWQFDDPDKVSEIVNLEYENLKSIAINGNQIIFTGKVKLLNLNNGKSSYIPSMAYFLKDDTPQSEKDKLLEALTHWVWMKGVDLVK